MTRVVRSAALMAGLSLAVGACESGDVAGPSTVTAPAALAIVESSPPPIAAGQVWLCLNGPAGSVTFSVSQTAGAGGSEGTLTSGGSPTLSAGQCIQVWDKDVPVPGETPSGTILDIPATVSVTQNGLLPGGIFTGITFSGDKLGESASGMTATTLANVFHGTVIIFHNGECPSGTHMENGTCVPDAPHLTVSKSADAATVTAGSQVGFSMTVTNSGPGTATDVTLTDALPSGLAWSVAGDSSPTCTISGTTLSCSFGTLAVGGSATAHVVAATSNSLCGVYTNPRATAAASNHDAVSSGPATVHVTGCVFPRLTVVKSADAGSVTAGGQAGFTMTVTNSGDGAATGVTLTDALPAGLPWTVAGDSSPTCTISGSTLSCTFGTLAAGASATAHVVAVTGNSSCGTYTNLKATASSTNHGSVSSGSATVHVTGCVAFCTATQGGWGQGASGNNIGSMRDAYFKTVYPTSAGLVVGTSTRSIKLTSAAAVEAFLPAGSTPGQLTKSHTNPLITESGIFGGQVTALKLNVDFSLAGIGNWQPGLASMVVATGPSALVGKTVSQILAIAQGVLAGGALPGGVSLSDLNEVVDSINNSNNDGCGFGDGSLKR